MTENSTLILVVDAERNLCGVVRHPMEKEGDRVLIAYDGSTALELVRSFNPDIIVLDFTLQDNSIQELCQNIREISSCRIVCFNSGVNSKRDPSVKKSSHDINSLINKPASIERILSMAGNTLVREVVLQK